MEDGRTGQKVSVWKVSNGYIISLMDENETASECRVVEFSRYGSYNEVGQVIEKMLGGDPERKKAKEEFEQEQLAKPTDVVPGADAF